MLLDCRFNQRSVCLSLSSNELPQTPRKETHRSPTHQNLHRRLGISHLRNQVIISGQDLSRGDVAPDIIGAEVHHDDVRPSS